MKPELSPKIILILGMHRSGTSLIAKLIAKWGAFMGEDLMPADKHNEAGYWEYNPLVKFHDKLLENTNNKWYAPSEEINTKELLIECGDEAKELVDQMDKGGEVWCWKDPRMTLFLDFWKEILVGREVVYILSKLLEGNFGRQGGCVYSLKQASGSYCYLIICSRQTACLDSFNSLGVFNLQYF